MTRHHYIFLKVLHTYLNIALRFFSQIKYILSCNFTIQTYEIVFECDTTNKLGNTTSTTCSTPHGRQLSSKRVNKRGGECLDDRE